jgi:hypothetical protein
VAYYEAVGNTSRLYLENNLAATVPVFYYLEVKVNSGGSLTKNITISTSGLHVYGVWAVQGKVPTIAGIEYSKSREIGAPLILSTDLTPQQAVVGQTYLEYDTSGMEVEKVATEGYCIKPINSNAVTTIFRCLNKSTAGFKWLKPSGTLSAQAYDDFLGGENATASNNLYTGNMGAVASIPALRKFTVLMRITGGIANQVRMYFVNNGNNNNLTLQADGTWVANQGTKPVLAQYITGENIAFSFTSPSSAELTALGGSPEFVVTLGSGGKLSLATIVQGSSACI